MHNTLIGAPAELREGITDRIAAMVAGASPPPSTIEALEKSSADVIVSTSTSCAAMLLQDYEHIFADDPDWQARAKRLAEQIRDRSV